MIFQNIPIDNSAAIAEALTAAEITRQELAATQEQLEQANAQLVESEEMLTAAEAAYTEGVNSI